MQYMFGAGRSKTQFRGNDCQKTDSSGQLTVNETLLFISTNPNTEITTSHIITKQEGKLISEINVI